MSAIHSEPGDHHYWKAAISHLPTQQQRDAAWEFFISRFVGNPKTADTISGTVMVMEAHGLYMLALPRKFHDEAVVPLEASMERFHEDSQRLLVQQAEANQATLEASEKAHQTAENALTSVVKLEDAIRHGWQEVKTERLAERIHAEMEQTLLQPLAVQCRQLEEATPAIKEAIDQLIQSARQLRAFHFRGILAGFILTCLVITGGYLWILHRDYQNQIDTVLDSLYETNSINRDAFRKLDRLGAKVHVSNVKDDRGRPIEDRYALVMEAGYDVLVRETSEGKEAGIFFQSLDLEQRIKKLLNDKPKK